MDYQKQALKSIKNQIGEQPPDQVYVIELDGIPFEEITTDMKQWLEKCSSLQMLTINNCNLFSLKNFPHCPAIIRLDLISNKLKGRDLQYLSNIRQLNFSVYNCFSKTLFLSQNEITSISDLHQITHMRKMLQLNLIGNDVCDVQDYENQMFALFPSLKILDGYNRNQKQPSEQNLLQESVNRINKNLFEQKPQQSLFSQSSQVPNLFQKKPVKTFQPAQPAPFSFPLIPYKAPVSKEESKKQVSKKEIKKKQNKKDKKDQNKMQIEEPKKKSLKRSIKKLNSKGTLIFPKGRVGRQLRQRMPTYRVSPKAAVFLTGCIEYLCFELLEVATEQAKNAKKKRIQPEHIIQAVRFHDEEFSKVLSNVTIAGKALI